MKKLTECSVKIESGSSSLIVLCRMRSGHVYSTSQCISSSSASDMFSSEYCHNYQFIVTNNEAIMPLGPHVSVFISVCLKAR